MGISVMTGSQILSAIDISKKFHGRLPIVWGGMHPTLLPTQVIENRNVDYVIVGEGEEAFLSLLSYLDTGLKQDFSFLSKKSERFKHNYLSDLNLSAKIDFKKYPIAEDYFVKRDGFDRAFTIETSRGCPHKCAFCHNSAKNIPYRFVKPTYVLDIITYLYDNYKIDGIVFQEDNFFVNLQRAETIVSNLKRVKIGWKANCRFDYLSKIFSDSTFLGDIVDSNCRVLQFGIESGSQEVINSINKGIDINNVIMLNQKLSHYPIKIRYNFIIGFPGESESDRNATLSLIDRLMSDNKNVLSPFLNIYTPYPGTPLYAKAIQYGYKPPATLHEWASCSWGKAREGFLTESQINNIEFLSNKFFNKSKYLN